MTLGLNEASLHTYTSAIKVGTDVWSSSRALHRPELSLRADALMWKVLAARLAIWLQQLSSRQRAAQHWELLFRARTRLPWGWVGVSVGGKCFKTITETWQAGALGVRIWVS